MGLKRLLFPTSPPLLGYEIHYRHKMVTNLIQIKAVATFHINLKACMNISFIVLVKILMLIKLSYISVFLFLSIIEPRMVLTFSTHGSISFKHVSFWYYVLGVTPDHIPLKYRFPKKRSNQIRHIYIIEVTFNTYYTKYCI